MKRIQEIDSMIATLEARIVKLKAEREELLAIQEKANAYDSLRKVVQDEDGNGTMENPYKNWFVGDSVEEGKWYQTEDGYLWEAIKSGVPTSTTDDEYFDVVGI